MSKIIRKFFYFFDLVFGLINWYLGFKNVKVNMLRMLVRLCVFFVQDNKKNKEIENVMHVGFGFSFIFH